MEADVVQPDGSGSLRDARFSDAGPTILQESFLRPLLEASVTSDASDIHITSGSVPHLRVHGGFRPVENAVISNESLIDTLRIVLPQTTFDRLAETGSIDFSLALPDGSRFRVNASRNQSGLALAMRRLPSVVPELDSLGLPAPFRELLELPRGLILVTGPTGSGKTTTLASAVQALAISPDRHIVTLEEPIEYRHANSRAIIHQREIPTHTPSFSAGLRDALRQDPNVIIVGEMRDNETIRVALTAAETGHLVISTLHTNSAAGTINRIIDTFPEGDKPHIRTQLSTTLRAVLCQQLASRADGSGRVLAYEFMRVIPAIANLVREGKTYQIPSVLQTNRKQGMILLPDHLASLRAAGTISDAEARRLGGGQE